MKKYSSRSYGWDNRRHGTQLKPENALNRASQLLQVSKAEEANETLYSIITDSQARHKRQWTKNLESIMLKLMELSVELRKSNMVKEALHKYRAMCLATNVQSLEDVVRLLVKLAEARTEQARQSIEDAFSAESVTQDLEEATGEAPDTLLLEAAGADTSRDRSDRQLVVPWMKFLWEIYRVVLDIVKTHVKLENCYQEMSIRAFSFCLKYSRFMEFRRLCDMLRQHMQTLIKTQTPRTPNDVQISNPDTTQRFLETRFTQLQTAVELNHWQEAYRTIEDIHTLITLSKKAPKPQTMAIYYSNLMQVFWVSDNFLYHAHALMKLYTLSVKQNRNLSPDDMRLMASKLLLSALSIPVYDVNHEKDFYGSYEYSSGGEAALRNQRMAALLGLTSTQSRASLMESVIAKGVLDICDPELRELHSALEGEMNPLTLAEKLQPSLGLLEKNADLKEYRIPLIRIAVFRLLDQLGKVYSVMRLKDLQGLASFATPAEIEQVALEALKTRAVGLRFDHQRKSVRFETRLFASDAMRLQLGNLARQLAAAVCLGEDNTYGDSSPASVERRRAAILLAKNSAAEEQEKLLLRKAIIEERRDAHERRVAEAERVAKEKAEAERLRREEIQKVKREQEELRREQEKIKKEQNEKEQADLRRLKEEIQAKAGVELQAKTKEESDEESILDRDQLLTKRWEEENKQKKEQEKKMTNIIRRMDHMERAMREAQRPLLEELRVHEANEAVERAKEARKKAIEDAEKKFAEDTETRKSLIKVEEELRSFALKLSESVDAEFELWLAEQKRRQEEELRRQAEEELRRQAEEEERQRLEAEQRKREEAEERERIELEEEEGRRLAEEIQRREEERMHQERERMEMERQQALKQVSPPFQDKPLESWRDRVTAAVDSAPQQGAYVPPGAKGIASTACTPPRTLESRSGPPPRQQDFVSQQVPARPETPTLSSSSGPQRPRFFNSKKQQPKEDAKPGN